MAINSEIIEISHRLDTAIRGQNHTDYWSDDRACCSAPDGLSYFDWINEAFLAADNEITRLKRIIKELEQQEDR